MKRKITGVFKKAGAVIFAAACLFCLFLPLPKKVTLDDRYECVWSDGSVSTESYASAYQSLAGIDGAYVLLERNGMTGRIESGAGSAYSTLEKGSLGELLQCSVAGTRIGSAALYRAFSDRVWYNGEYYVFTGSRVKRVSRATGRTLVCLEGNLSARVLKETNASTLYLRRGAAIKADIFTESNVKTVFAEQPYAVSGGAVYLNTVSGKRLLAAIAGLEALTLDESLRFADEGALIACQNLQALTLPFVGSAKSPDGSAYIGELAYLFSNGREFRVPQTLSHIKVTGGRLEADAFYSCTNLKVIDTCEVDPGEISEYAFAGLASLEVLHTPKSGVSLTGSFTSYTAECGCTVYIKTDSQN